MIGILLLLIVLRAPYWFMDLPLLQAELVWTLIGERMAAGHSMYVGIIDDTGPFSAGVYWLIHLVAGRSVVAFHLAAGALLLFQIAFFNSLLIQYKAFEDNTYIPALVMTILLGFSYDFLILSPALMGTTFILLSLGQLFSHTVRHQEHPESVLLVGIFGGTALCFHFPLVAFLPFIVVAGIAISGFTFQQLLLCLAGYLLPFCLCAVYYFWMDGSGSFLAGFVFARNFADHNLLINYSDMALLLAWPLAFTFLGFMLITLMKRLTVNQQKQHQLIVLFLVFSVFSLFFTNKLAPYQLIVMVPGMAFFISQIFPTFNNKRVRATVFNIYFLGICLTGYGWAYYRIKPRTLDHYTLNPAEKHEITRNSNVIVLGNDLAYYQEASLAGPYLNFRLSEPIFRNPDQKNLTDVYLSFCKEKPEYVIDEEGAFAEIIQYLPKLQEDYSPVRAGIYKRN